MKKMKLVFKKLTSFVMMIVLTVALFVPVIQVSAASVGLNKTKIVIVVGQKYRLTLNGTKKAPTWKTSNKKVVTVKKDGSVTGVSKGTANVTATLGKKTYKCKVIVEAPKISLTKKTINAGEKFTLKLNGTTKSVKWTTSNKKIATVSQNGVVKGIAKGTANILATVGGKKYVCKVTVETPKISLTKKTIDAGEKFTLKLNGTTKSVKWTTSNKKVATVSQNGVVKGIAKGTANIIATVGGKKYVCKVTVKEPRILSVSTNELTIKDEGTITVTYKGSGTITCNIDNTDIIDCEWSEEWDGDSCELYVTALKYGKATITITDDESDEICIIKVNSNKKSSTVDNFNKLKNYIKIYGKLNSEGNRFIVRELEDDDYEYRSGIVYNSANDTLEFVYSFERKYSNGIEDEVSFEIDPYSSYSDIDAIVRYYSNNDLYGIASANAVLPIKEYDGQTNLNFVFSSNSAPYLATDSGKRVLNSSLKLAFISWNILISSKVGLTLNDIGFTSYVAD